MTQEELKFHVKISRVQRPTFFFVKSMLWFFFDLFWCCYQGFDGNVNILKLVRCDVTLIEFSFGNAPNYLVGCIIQKRLIVPIEIVFHISLKILWQNPVWAAQLECDDDGVMMHQATRANTGHTTIQDISISYQLIWVSKTIKYVIT